MKNESTADRLIRAVLAIAFATIAYTQLEGSLMVISYIIATVLAFTSITGFCILYKPFGIRTNKPETPEM